MSWKRTAAPRKLPPIKQRPVCRQCGQPLRPLVYRVEGADLADAYAQAALWRQEAVDSLYVIRIERSETTNAVVTAYDIGKLPGDRGVVAFKTSVRHRISYWTGQYGCRGQGLFCKEACGYAYGVRAARQADTQIRYTS